MKKLPKLPSLLDRKIYKTGQTRGADDDVIYQNRVGRNSTVLIPYSLWEKYKFPPNQETYFEKGFICLISPEEYFNNLNIETELKHHGLSLGNNLLVFYKKRSDWQNYPPLKNWQPANARKSPLNRQYVARIAATTAIENGSKISLGYTTKRMKGAGIRLYEYASKRIIDQCKLQLEAIFWLCYDAIEIMRDCNMTDAEIELRKSTILKRAEQENLLDYQKLQQARIIDNQHQTVCPLCLDKLSAQGFMNRLIQAEGREVHDLTVTEINLFHIDELRYGKFNHRPYNLGWGHHHCNVVVKDSGINETLQWMEQLIERNNNFLKMHRK
ncbi:BstXI family restriction endonuclease [Neisseria sicca]|jgi:hypothetical protein|uniref:BstXI family restriction endonuclease n=1 Tax=Neisseria sicca TaxID=490 RepID=UPI000664E09D|nr:BstXI family restriction endonuclease [Neisseria sicca]